MYETRIGKFKKAVDPCTTSFREFPSWVGEKFQVGRSDGQQLNYEGDEVGEPPKPPLVAMYCTGGIRCEKASNFLLSKGFEEVYHSQGGILKYLEEVPESESLWEGECFVFDKRVSFKHGLVQGSFKLCMDWCKGASSCAIELSTILGAATAPVLPELGAAAAPNSAFWEQGVGPSLIHYYQLVFCYCETFRNKAL